MNKQKSKIKHLSIGAYVPQPLTQCLWYIYNNYYYTPCLLFLADAVNHLFTHNPHLHGNVSWIRAMVIPLSLDHNKQLVILASAHPLHILEVLQCSTQGSGIAVYLGCKRERDWGLPCSTQREDNSIIHLMRIEIKYF